MQCNYFILTKPNNANISKDEDNNIICMNAKMYILPRNNMEYYKNNGLFEKYLIEWSKQFCNKEQNILDIGAHTGTYAISLANHCKHVYAFEPQKMTYYSLCGSVALSNINNITCMNYGLGSEEQIGIKTLNIISQDGGGSSLHTNNNAIIRTEQIEIKTLDSLNIENISFIKIDVEENELDVLKYSQNTLKKSNYPKIIFESNKSNPTLFDFLENIGYRIIKIGGTNNMFLASENENNEQNK